MWMAWLGIWAGLAGTRSTEGRVIVLAEHALTLTLPELEGFVDLGKNHWRGRLGASWIDVSLQTLASAKYDLDEPDEVLDVGPSYWRDTEHGRNEPGKREPLAGHFGFASYAVLERSELHERNGGALTGLRLLLGGLLPEAGYWITVEAKPAPDAAGEAELRGFLTTGVAYAGAVRDAAWSDEEVRARWQRDAADVAQGKLATLRTAHYVLLTDAPSAEGFGKRMEECYAAVRKFCPFEDVPGRRLLPVLLFRTREEFVAFYARNAGLPAEFVQAPKGQVYRGAYATWAEKPGDPAHLHEAAHQVFSQRLGLAGGGTWFQEGVAEFLASKPSERAAAAAQVKRGQHVPLRTLVASASLEPERDFDAPPPEGPGDAVREAALLIECLRESAWGKEHFPAFLLRMGKGTSGVADLENALQSIYGIDLAALETRFVEYCKKR
jgi:hypothetical protein